MKNIFILLTSLFLVFANADDKVLKVGMELAYPPFETSDTNGNPSGISVDLAKELGKYLGKEVIIENIAWDGLIPSLKTGKIDLIISSMTITEERAKSIDFSIPYAQSNLAILTYKNSGIKNIDDLNNKGKKIAVKKGSTGHIYARNYLRKANILVFDKENSAVLEIIQQKADGFLYDQMTIFKNWQKHKDKTEAILETFQSNPEYWGIAIRKGNTELKKQVDEFIKQAKENGAFNDLAHKYLKDIKTIFDERNIQFFF